MSKFQLGLIVGIFCSASALAHAQQQFGDPVGHPGEYVTQRTSPPNGTSIDVFYFVGSGFTTGPGSMTSAITAAAAVWNAAGALVQLVPSLVPTSVTITSFAIPFPFQGTTSLSIGAPTGAYPDSTPGNHIDLSSTLVNVDPSLPWFTGPGPVPGGALDFEAFMIREFGHALGLGYVSGDPTSVMNSTLAPGPALRVPSAADIAALQTLYGAPEPATWALFGVGLAALAAAKKKSRRRATPAL